MTKSEFMSQAKSIKVTIEGRDFLAEPKEFASGSFGYYLTGKAVVEVGGNPVELHLGGNFVVKGSKPQPATAKPEQTKKATATK